MATQNYRVNRMKRHAAVKAHRSKTTRVERRLASKIRRYERAPQGKSLGKRKVPGLNVEVEVFGKRTPPKGMEIAS